MMRAGDERLVKWMVKTGLITVAVLLLLWFGAMLAVRAIANG